MNARNSLRLAMALLGIFAAGCDLTGPISLFPSICTQIAPKAVVDSGEWVIDRSSPPVARLKTGTTGVLLVALFANNAPDGCSITGSFGIPPSVSPVEWETTDRAVLSVTPFGETKTKVEALAPGVALVAAARSDGWGRAEFALCGSTLSSCVPVSAIVVTP